MVQQYEREFQIAALKSFENDRMVSSNLSTSMTPGGWINVVIDPEGSADKTGYNSSGNGQYNGGSGNLPSLNSYDSGSDSSETDVFESPKKGSGTQPPVAHYHDTLSNKHVYSQTWRGLQLLATDPDPSIAAKADAIINSVHDKVKVTIWNTIIVIYHRYDNHLKLEIYLLVILLLLYLPTLLLL